MAEKEQDPLQPLRIQVRRTVDGKEPVAPLSAEKMAGMEKRSKVKLHSDPYLWGIYLMLLIFSVVELYSASSTEVKGDNVYAPVIQHGIYLLVGLAVVFALQNIHYKYFMKMAWPVLFLSLGLLAWSTFHGEVINGAMRALRFGSITVQPAEISKLAVVLALAAVMARNQMPLGITNRGFITCLLIMGVFCSMMFTNGLTNMLIIFTVATAMFLIGGLQWRKFLALLVMYAIVGGAVYFVKYGNDDSNEGTATEMTVQTGGDETKIDRTEMRAGRISSFLEGVDPDDEITDNNRQAFFSRMAQANGGLVGNGPGNSRESARLPLAFSDYIYSIVVEDTGFVGGVFLLALYLFLVARAGRIAWKCTRAFPALLILGCSVMIVFQALIHIAIVVGVFPVSGQPLPFISKGGTSILVMSAAMGMMLSVSKYAVQNGKKKDADRALKEAVAGSENEAYNPTQIN